LLFIGILSSAQNVSRNVEIRRELYKNAKSELIFLREIGEAQLVQELVTRCKHIARNIPISENKDDVDLEHKEAINIITQVMNELNISKDRIKSQQDDKK
jgi:hypothetical protein